MNGNLENRVRTLETEMQEIRAILRETAQNLREASAIAVSNARSVQAWEARIEENKIEAEEERSLLRVEINELKQASRENIEQHFEFFRRFDETQANINRILDRLEGQNPNR